MTKLPPPKYEVTDDNHKYTILLPDGEKIGPLKSVTGVLDILAKPALIGWAAREAAGFFKTEIMRLGQRALDVATLEQIAKDAAQAHRRKAKDAADLGSACHDAFEAIIKGQEVESYPKELEEPVRAFKNYRLKSDIEIVATELAVGSVNHRFGGRIDFVGYSKSRGGWGVGDYKTSSGFYGNEYAYQAGGGYALALEEMYGITVAWTEIVRFSKKPPFDSEARPVTDLAAAKSGFLSALDSTRSAEVKLIGEPTFSSIGQMEISKPATNGSARKKKVSDLVGF